MKFKPIKSLPSEVTLEVKASQDLSDWFDQVATPVPPSPPLATLSTPIRTPAGEGRFRGYIVGGDLEACTLDVRGDISITLDPCEATHALELWGDFL